LKSGTHTKGWYLSFQNQCRQKSTYLGIAYRKHASVMFGRCRAL